MKVKGKIMREDKESMIKYDNAGKKKKIKHGSRRQSDRDVGARKENVYKYRRGKK
jgi:hypothetical protein